MSTKAELEREMGELQAKLNQMAQAARAKEEAAALAATAQAEKENLIAELQRRLDESAKERKPVTNDTVDPVDKDASDASERPEGTKPPGGSARSTKVGSVKLHRSVKRSSVKKSRDDSDPDSSDSESPSSESDQSSDSNSEADSDSDDGKRHRKSKKSKAIKKSSNTTLDWRHFDFSLDKENHLRGVENWSIYKNALMVSLESIGYDEVNKMSLTRMDQLRIAKAIIKTSKRDVLELIDGIKKGTKILRLLGKTYKTSGRIHRQAIWEETFTVTFDGGNPVAFISQFKKKIRECRDAGLKMSSDHQIAMFLAATKDKAYGWTKRQKTAMRRQDLSLQDLMEDLIDEFRAKIGEKKSDTKDKGNAHNAASGKKSSGNRGKPGRKPAFNDKNEPLCFNCQEYGHMAKDCKRPKKEKPAGTNNSGSNHQSIMPLPPALKDLEAELNSFHANVGQARLREMEALIEQEGAWETKALTRQEGELHDGFESTSHKPKGAPEIEAPIAREVEPNNGPEGAATTAPTAPTEQKNGSEGASHKSKGTREIEPEGARRENSESEGTPQNESKGRPGKKMIDLSSHHLMLEVPEDHPHILATCKQEGGCDDSGYGGDSDNGGNCVPPKPDSDGGGNCELPELHDVMGEASPRQSPFREAPSEFREKRLRHRFYSHITEEKTRHHDFQSYTKNEVQDYLKGYPGETLGAQLRRYEAELDKAKDRIAKLEMQNEKLQKGLRASQNERYVNGTTRTVLRGPKGEPVSVYKPASIIETQIDAPKRKRKRVRRRKSDMATALDAKVVTEPSSEAAASGTPGELLQKQAPSERESNPSIRRQPPQPMTTGRVAGAAEPTATEEHHRRRVHGRERGRGRSSLNTQLPGRAALNAKRTDHRLEDNTGAINWAYDSTIKKRRRHIYVAYNYVRQEVEDGHIEMKYVESAQNPADGFTKPLSGPDHTKFVKMPGMVDTEEDEKGEGAELNSNR
jgi:hypothetical protein